MIECKSCFDNITEKNKVKYTINQKKEWHNSKYCEMCVTYLLNISWNLFTEQVEKADCKKALAKILEVGPPINLRDKIGFPNPNNPDILTEIDTLFFCSNKTIKDAKLKGSFTGNKRKEYITFLHNFKFN